MVSDNAHVFVLLSVVIVTLPDYINYTVISQTRAALRPNSDYLPIVSNLGERMKISSDSVLYIGWSKKLAHFLTPYNYIKYRLIFKLFSLSKSGEKL